MNDIKDLIARIEAENNHTHLTRPDDNYIRTAYMRRGSLLNECGNALQRQGWQDDNIKKAWFDGWCESIGSSEWESGERVWPRSKTYKSLPTTSNPANEQLGEK